LVLGIAFADILESNKSSAFNKQGCETRSYKLNHFK
jgi:hypothetical protein